MVNEIHLNRRGFKGDAIACFFKSELPREGHSERSRASDRNQSDLLSVENTEKTLPSVKETVCTEPNVSQFQVLKSVFNFYDNLSANLSIQNGLKRCRQALNVPYPLPGQVFATDPYKNIFRYLGGSNVH